MGIDRPPDKRFGPRAGDLEGEPDEPLRDPPKPQTGRIEITEKKVPGKNDGEGKHWWQRP